MTKQTAILYYDVNGNPVYNPAFINAQRASGEAIDSTINVAPPDCFCGDHRNYQVPKKFTLRADNTAGLAAANFKMQPFDMMVEAVNGSMGTAFFQLLQANFGAGTIPLQNGNNIFGLDALRYLTATYAIVINKIKATGAYITGLSIANLDMIVLKGNINNVEREVRTFTLAKDYQSQGVLENNDTWLITANKGFFIADIPNGANGLIDLEFSVAGFKPYTELL